MNRLVLPLTVLFVSLLSNAAVVKPKSMSLSLRTSPDTLQQVFYTPSSVRGPSLDIRLIKFDEYGKQISEKGTSVVFYNTVCGTPVDLKKDCAFWDEEVGSGSAVSYYFHFSCLNNAVNGFAEFIPDRFAHVVCGGVTQIMLSRNY